MKIHLAILSLSVAVVLFLNSDAFAQRQVVVWSEGTAPKDVYPSDINGAVAEGLARLNGWQVVTASLDDPEQGLGDERLNRCDVLVWWGHKRHGEVKDELVEKIVRRVKDDGMGFIALHSAHFAKPNIALMSLSETPEDLLGKVKPKGRVAAWGAYLLDSVTLKIVPTSPSHPIAQGIEEFTIDHSERYSDPYAVPTPQAVVFAGDAKRKDGSIDRSQVGLCWQVGKGRVFYFQAGHETNPVFFDPNVRKIIANAVEWSRPTRR
jgi:trehalose utilization protein